MKTVACILFHRKFFRLVGWKSRRNIDMFDCGYCGRTFERKSEEG